MHNKFVIVLALLITISMANKLDDEDIEERMRRVPFTFDDSYELGYMHPRTILLASLSKKLAILAASDASLVDINLEKEKIILQYAKYVSDDVLNKINENNYFAARDLIAAESYDKKFETHAKPIFAYYYIKTLLKHSNPAITLEDISLLYA